MQDYDPRTVKVPSEVMGKMSGMCSTCFRFHMGSKVWRAVGTSALVYMPSTGLQ